MRRLLVICIISLISLSLAAQEKRLAILFTNDIHSSGDYARMATLIEQQRKELEQQGYPVILVDAGDIAMGSVYHTIFSTHAFEYQTLGKMGYDAYTFGNHDFDLGLHGLYQMFASARQQSGSISAQNSTVSIQYSTSSLYPDSSFNLPAVLCANITAAGNDAEFRERTGVKSTMLIEKSVAGKLALGEKTLGSADIQHSNRVKIGLFGLMGEHAYSCITCKDSLLFTDRAEAAAEAVKALQEAGADYIVALSHGGTLWANGSKVEQGKPNWKQLKTESEDGQLALQVPQINAIISGHDHESFTEPLIYGNTVIASSGSKNANLGKMLFKGDSLVSYELLPVTPDAVSGFTASNTVSDSAAQKRVYDSSMQMLAPDPAMQQWLAENYKFVEERFYNTSHLKLDDTIAYLQQPLDLTITPQGNLLLGQLIAESYREAALLEAGEADDAYGVEGVAEIAGDETLSGREDMIAIVPYGVIRGGLKEGYVTNHNVFNVLPLGMGEDGEPGYPLVKAWLSGEELEDICELNASVAGGMEDARLFFAGMSFKYNRYAIPFTRVTEVLVAGEPVEKQRLYPVVTGLYTAQLMGMLESSSYGLLSVQPKDSAGRPVSNLESMILKRKVYNDDTLEVCRQLAAECIGLGQPVAEWAAFAQYVKKTELKNLNLETCSIDASTPIIYLKYLVLLAAGTILLVLLLRFGKRLLYRQP